MPHLSHDSISAQLLQHTRGEEVERGGATLPAVALEGSQVLQLQRQMEDLEQQARLSLHC